MGHEPIRFVFLPGITRGRFSEELAEARERLRVEYSGFTEGFAFPDLREAATLIRQPAFCSS